MSEAGHQIPEAAEGSGNFPALNLVTRIFGRRSKRAGDAHDESVGLAHAGGTYRGGIGKAQPGEDAKRFVVLPRDGAAGISRAIPNRAAEAARERQEITNIDAG